MAAEQPRYMIVGNSCPPPMCRACHTNNDTCTKCGSIRIGKGRWLMEVKPEPQLAAITDAWGEYIEARELCLSGMPDATDKEKLAQNDKMKAKFMKATQQLDALVGTKTS